MLKKYVAIKYFQNRKKHDPGLDFVPYYPKNKNLKVNNNKQNMKIWESNSPKIFKHITTFSNQTIIIEQIFTLLKGK